MKKAIVTGANGFIGTALCTELSAKGTEIIALIKDENEDISQIENLKEIRIVYCDFSNYSDLENLIFDRDIDVIFHLAWAGASGNNRSDYNMQLGNVKMTCDLVKSAAKMKVKKFVGAGTLAQYDCMAYIGKNGASPSPVSCYGTAKISAHYMSKAVANSAGIEHIWCILSNLYGVGDTTNNFVNFAAKKMLSGERAAFTSAEQNYDFVYISDIIQGIYLCGENGKNNNTYYIGSGEARPLKEYIKIIRDAVDPQIQLYIGEIEFKGQSLPLEVFDCKHICEDTGYLPKVKFEDGINDTINWLRENIK